MSQKESTQTDAQQENWVPTLKPEVTECIEFLGNWNMSLLEFYVRRVQQYCRAPFEVHPFSSPDDHLRFQERFLTKMVADYAEQVDKMVALVRREQQATCDPSQPSYEARLLQAQDDAAEIIALAKAQAERIVASAEERAGQTANETGEKATTVKRRKSA